MSGSVIQGVFPHGISAAARVSARPTSPARPEWVAQRIAFGNAAQRRLPTPPPVQRHSVSPNMTAVALPQGFAGFAATGGQPLPSDVRQSMESFFGGTFGDVRIHVGPHVAAIGAVACTHGTHIHFAPGRYNPATPEGRQILGHELAHVVQQRSGRVHNPFGTGVAVVQDTMMEAEADRLGRGAAMHRQAVQPKMAFNAIQMEPTDNAKSRITTKLNQDGFGDYATEMAKLLPSERDVITNYWDSHGAGKSTVARGRAALWMAAKIEEYLGLGVITYSNNFDTKHVADVIGPNSARDAGNSRNPKPVFNTTICTSYLIGKIRGHAATQANGNGKQFTEAASVAGAANISLAELHVASQNMRTIALGIFQYTVSYNKTTAASGTVTLDIYHMQTA